MCGLQGVGLARQIVSVRHTSARALCVGPARTNPIGSNPINCVRAQHGILSARNEHSTGRNTYVYISNFALFQFTHYGFTLKPVARLEPGSGVPAPGIDHTLCRRFRPWAPGGTASLGHRGVPLLLPRAAVLRPLREGQQLAEFTPIRKLWQDISCCRSMVRVPVTDAWVDNPVANVPWIVAQRAELPAQQLTCAASLACSASL